MIKQFSKADIRHKELTVLIYVYALIKGCPETDDLISDKESGGLTDTTKNLIQRILDDRSCGEKSDGMYCCAKKPIAKVNETECKFFTNF